MKPRKSNHLVHISASFNRVGCLACAWLLSAFSARAGAPGVTSVGVSNVTSMSATLYGKEYANGTTPVTYWFAYTQSGHSYSNTLPASTSSTVTNSFSSTVSLSPSTTYQFQFIATNSAGSNAGNVVAFTTSNAASPTVTTLGAGISNPTYAVLNGTVNPNGLATTWWFQYGQTTNYGLVTPSSNLVAGTAAVLESGGVSLSQGTTYHYRLVATNNLGTNFGADTNFTTPFWPATVTTGSATNQGGGVFSLSATVNPNGSFTSGWFNWGPGPGYGNSTLGLPLGNGVSPTNFTQSVTGMVGGVLYHYQAVGRNSGGVAAGSDGTFYYLTVSSLADSGAGSLRAAIQIANPGDTITIATNGTIVLTNGELLITNSLTLTGPGANNLAVSGNFSSRVFDIGASGGVEVGPMNGAHDDHTATLLDDGTVLLVGGPSYSFPVSASEVFSLAGDTWTTNSPNAGPVPRFGHTATLLNDGTVLVAGGNDPVNTAFFTSPLSQIYTPSLGTWALANPLNTWRYDHTATMLDNGVVLVAGGVDTNGNTLSSAETYSSAVFSAANSMTTAREWHTATLLANGNVLVAGGLGGSGPLASAEIYNSGGGSWTATNSLNIARYDHTATLLSNGMVLVVGGVGAGGPLGSVELFNPATGGWTLTNSLTTVRCHHTATLLANGQVLVAGGSDGAGPLASVELLDPTTMTWTLLSPMTLARELHTATLISNGAVLLAGGIGLDGPLVSAELYQPGSGVTVSISGLSIINGHAPDGVPAGAGGAINNSGNLTLTACALSGNSAGNGLSASATNGYAVNGGNGGDGGAINNLGTLSLNACTLNGNLAGAGGSGVPQIFGSATITINAGQGGNGGAINNLGVLTISNCTFSANQAGAAGDNSTLGNGGNGSAGGNGGAIFNAGRLGLTSATLSGNSAGLGGGAGNGGFGGSGGNGGAIYSVASDNLAALCNCLVALNNPGLGGADGGSGPGLPGLGPDLFGTLASQGHNLLGKTDNSTSLTNGVDGDLVGTSASPINPFLGPLQANGGPTLTLALLPASPAVNAGDDSITGTDQRGLPRLSGLHVDIGAFELQLGPAFAAPTVSILWAGPATNSDPSRLYSLPVTANVNAGGLPTTAAINYGPTTSYGSVTPPVSAGSAASNVVVNLTLTGMMPGTIYHYSVQAANALGTGSSRDYVANAGLTGDFNGDGMVDQNELNEVYANYLPTSPWLYITNTVGLGSTNVVFSLVNSLGYAYTVQWTTNFNTWTSLGPANPLYQFTDTNAPLLPQRYYRLVYP
jgi:hypothetical protein